MRSWYAWPRPSPQPPFARIDERVALPAAGLDVAGEGDDARDVPRLCEDLPARVAVPSIRWRSVPAMSPVTASVGSKSRSGATAWRGPAGSRGTRRRARPVRRRAAGAVDERRNAKGRARANGGTRRPRRRPFSQVPVPRRLGAERLQDLLGEERLRALVADGEHGEERRLVRVEDRDAEPPPGAARVRTVGSAVQLDPVLPEDLRERRSRGRAAGRRR